MAVDVAADLYGRFELEQDGLVDKDVARPRTQKLDLVLLQLHLLPRPVPTDCAETRCISVSRNRCDAALMGAAGAIVRPDIASEYKGHLWHPLLLPS